MKKAAVAWLTVGDHRTYPVWCAWLDDALHIVGGGAGEQPLPGLATASRASVTARGDHGGRVVTWPAQVHRLRPGDEAWATVVPQLAGKRLNGPGGEELARRWADPEVLVCRLTPDGDPTEAGPTLPDGSLAAEVPQTPAVHRVRRPFRLHRVRNRRA
ncbi:hypothetical protein [Luedemannella helvata]|uniref:Uncharacterized protein n=1 Tax=Luedemannella helvata TaxID=349315 RepID=A0ABP4XAW4_9ACTN